LEDSDRRAEQHMPFGSTLQLLKDQPRLSAFAVAIRGKADMAYCSAHVCF